MSIALLRDKLYEMEKKFATISNFSTNSSTMVVTVFGKDYKELEDQIQTYARELEIKSTEE